MSNTYTPAIIGILSAEMGALAYDLFGWSGVLFSILKVALAYLCTVGIFELIKAIKERQRETVRIELEEPLKEGQSINYARGRSND